MIECLFRFFIWVFFFVCFLWYFLILVGFRVILCLFEINISDWFGLSNNKWVKYFLLVFVVWVEILIILFFLFLERVGSLFNGNINILFILLIVIREYFFFSEISCGGSVFVFFVKEMIVLFVLLWEIKFLKV